MENYLKKEDTTNSKTMTYQILTRVSDRAEGYLRAYNRAHEYDLTLFNLIFFGGQPHLTAVSTT